MPRDEEFPLVAEPITAQPYAVENEAAEVIMPRDEEFPLVAEPITAQPYAVENEAAEVIMPRDEEFPLVAEPITAQPYAVENEAAEVIMPRDEEFPLVAEPTTANAEESLFSPRIVDDAEIHYLRAISPEAQDEEYDPFAEPKITGPQFDEALSQNERAEETNQLQEQIPPMYHEFLDIFRQKEETETLPPSRDYDMRIDLIPQAKLAVAPLYQLTENEKTVLLETIERETTAGRIRPSNAAYGSPMFFVPKKDGRLRLVVDYHAGNNSASTFHGDQCSRGRFAPRWGRLSRSHIEQRRQKHVFANYRRESHITGRPKTATRVLSASLRSKPQDCRDSPFAPLQRSRRDVWKTRHGTQSYGSI
jgi:hypothetical protein